MEMAEESRSAATKQGATSYTLKTYAGLAHSVNPQEIADVLDQQSGAGEAGGGLRGEEGVRGFGATTWRGEIVTPK